MKLIRWGLNGQERPGICHEGRHFDLSGWEEDFGETFFATGGMTRLQKFWNENKGSLPEISGEARLGTPFLRPSKIICVGLNYADHARETGATPPKEPIIFFKSTTALCGPNDVVQIPKGSQKTDWEVELAVVISKRTSYVSEKEAAAAIAGYCIHNDLSERSFQLERSGQWVKGKSCDTFAPMGPYLVTPDELGDVNHLSLWLTLNGRKVQDSNTSNLIFGIPFLISYISQFMTLLPGDVISTGTPAGVGMGMNPPLYLKDGDVMELGIEGLGTCRQTVKNLINGR